MPRPAPGCKDQRTVLSSPRRAAQILDEECRRYVGGLANRLAMLLRAPKERRRPEQESGRVDSRALSSVKTGNRNVFVRYPKQLDRGTAVSILVDCSGSMATDGRDRMAGRAAYVLGCALDRAGFAFEVTGWSEETCRAGGLMWSRCEDHVEWVVKDFEDRWLKVRGRCAQIQARGNNDDATAVYYAARRLAKRTEERKLLIVLSDGSPAHYCGRFDADAQLRTVLTHVKGAGIQVAGIGIQSTAVEKFYQDSEVVWDLSELPRACTRMLERMTKGATK